MRSIVLFSLLASLLVGSLAGAMGCNRKGATPVFIKAPPVAVRPSPAPAPQPIRVEVPAADPTPVPPPPPSPETTETPLGVERTLPEGTIHAEYFDTAAGAGYRIVRGERQRIDNAKRDTIRIYPFYDSNQKEELILQWLEDGETLGPDGKPGVLALTFENLPPQLAYSGFSYVGRTQDPKLALAPLANATSADALRGVRVRFRYRTLNTKTNDGHRSTFGIRFEAMVPDSYKKRLDLGQIVATDEWLAFEADLSEAGNIDAFVECIKTEMPTGFKLLFAQGVKAELYKPGDTLLIDNIEFVAK